MSSDEKKDLTRIEDLGEYLHELNSEDDFQVPDLPAESEEVPDFGGDTEEPFSSATEDSNADFGSSEEGFDFGASDFSSNEAETEGESPEFSTSDFGGPDFESSDSENSDFGSSDFESSDFSTNDFSSEDSNEDSNFGEGDTFSEAPEETSFESTDFRSSEEPPAEEESSDFPSLDEEPAALEEEPAPVIEELAPLDAQEEVPVAAATPQPAIEPVQEYKAPENFADVKKFAESTSFTGMGAEGNPSFSVLIKNVRYIEDVTDILALMKELGLQADSEEQMKNRLMRGSLLVPRISEFAATLLAHKLRRFDVDIQVGLSDEIHPPKHKEEPETGLVSKFNLYQNQAHQFHFDDPKLEISQIIVAATPTLEGHQVVRYLGVASEHKILDGHVVEDESSTEVPRHYQELAQKLKAHALKAHSNAVVGLNYQLTPLPSEFGSSGSKYRLTCTGNLVWVNKL